MNYRLIFSKSLPLPCSLFCRRPSPPPPPPSFLKNHFSFREKHYFHLLKQITENNMYLQAFILNSKNAKSFFFLNAYSDLKTWTYTVAAGITFQRSQQLYSAFSLAFSVVDWKPFAEVTPGLRFCILRVITTQGLV